VAQKSGDMMVLVDDSSRKEADILSEVFSLIEKLEARIKQLEDHVNMLDSKISSMTNNAASQEKQVSSISQEIDTSEKHMREARELIQGILDSQNSKIIQKINSHYTKPVESQHKKMPTFDPSVVLDAIERQPLNMKDEKFHDFLVHLGADTKVRRSAKEVKKENKASQDASIKKDEKANNQAPEGQDFVFCDGSRAKNIAELYSHIMNSDDSVYSYHANSEKNDFALWVRVVLGYERLAGLIQLAKSKKETMDLLKKVI
jgi:TolA-binding protein